MNPESKFNAAVRGTLLLVGAGKMGSALLEGWLEKGLDGRRVTILDPHAPAATLDRFSQRAVTINPGKDDATQVDTLVLAIKPQSLAAAAPDLAHFTKTETLLVSIMAGKTLANLAEAFPGLTAFARAMPNTPAAVGRGATGIIADVRTSAEQKARIGALLEAVGTVEWLDDERLIDAVTALSGSGPAYVFYLTECLAKAGERAGLGPAAARRLARATVEGAGALMAAAPETAPETLRQNVTSPGGTTAAALAVMMADDRLTRLIIEAVEAARHRAAELAG